MMFALWKEWNWRVNPTVLCLGTDEDLEFYVRKCGDILGVTSKLPKDQQDAKHILEHIFFQVVEFKKLNQEAHWHGSPSGDVTRIDCLQYSLVLQVLTKCLQMNSTWWSLREWNFSSSWRVPANSSRVYKQALSRLEVVSDVVSKKTELGQRDPVRQHLLKWAELAQYTWMPESGVLFVPEPSTVLEWCMVVVKTSSLG